MRIAIVGTGVSGLSPRTPLHPRPRRHGVRGRRARRRPRQHRRRRGRRRDARASTPASSSTTSATTRASSRCSRELGVATQPTEMSFGVTDAASGLEYRGSNLNSLFAQRRNLVEPVVPPAAHRDRPLQPRRARALVADEPRWPGADRLPTAAAPADDESSRSTVPARGRYSDAFVAAVPRAVRRRRSGRPIPTTFTQFPMRSYARFMHNHGLLELRGPAAVAHDHRRLARATSTRSPRRSPIGSGSRLRCTRSSPAAGRAAARASSCSPTAGPSASTGSIVATHSDQALRMLADADAGRAVDARCDRVPAQHRDAAHRRAPAARRTARAGELELRGRRREPARHGHVLDEPAAGDRERDAAARHAQPSRRDRPAHVLAEFEYDHPVFDAAAMRAQRRRHEIQGPARHLLRRRVLGLRLPRGRRAERRSRSRRDRTPRDRRSVRPSICASRRVPHVTRHRAHRRRRPTPRVRTAPVPRVPRRRRAPGLARPAARLVGAPRRAGALPAATTSSTAATHTARRRGPRSRAGATRAPPDGPDLPARAPPHVRVARSTRSPSTTAGHPTATRSTRSCSRSRTRRGASGTGTCSTRGTAYARGRARRRRCTCRRSSRWTSSTACRGRHPATGLDLDIVVATGDSDRLRGRTRAARTPLDPAHAP